MLILCACSPTYATSIRLPSMEAVTLCFGLIIIKNFFNDCKDLTIRTDIYDIQEHFQSFMQANNNWMVGRIWPASSSLGNPVLKGALVLKSVLSTIF